MAALVNGSLTLGIHWVPERSIIGENPALRSMVAKFWT